MSSLLKMSRILFSSGMFIDVEAELGCPSFLESLIDAVLLSVWSSLQTFNLLEGV